MVTQSQFLRSGGCKRQVWLVKNRPVTNTEKNKMSYIAEQEILSAAKNYFPKGVDLDGKELSDFKINKVYFNALFKSYLGEIKCDIIKCGTKGVEIYRVKSGSGTEHHIKALLFQRWILNSLGYKVSALYLMSINKDYVRGRHLDYKKLFTLEEYSNKTFDGKLKSKIKFIKNVLTSQDAPKSVMSRYCSGCEYFEECFKLPKNNIFKLGNLGFDVKVALYNHGILTFQDYLKLPEINDNCRFQIESEINKKDIVNKKGIEEFLGKLKYPLGFLDFEAISPAVPKFKGTKPNERIITQFSYHYMKEEGGELYHQEFIGDGLHYPERLVAENLVRAIGQDHTVLMYSNYEKNCILGLMSKFPEFKTRLSQIKDNLVDLEKPFENKYLYNYKMQGKSSIKYVLPALYPNDDELDYKKINIKDGAEAVEKYLEMETADKETRKRIKKDLLEYCKLDSFAMVKLLDSLKKAIREQ